MTDDSLTKIDSFLHTVSNLMDFSAAVNLKGFLLHYPDCSFSFTPTLKVPKSKIHIVGKKRIISEQIQINNSWEGGINPGAVLHS